MDTTLFTKFVNEGLINEDELKKAEHHKQMPLSVHWELRTLLYLGIVLVTSAVGILIYKNIDTMSHTLLLIIIACVCLLCFGYCLKNSKGYTNKKVESLNIWFDYILLLGCLLLLTFIGYIQFEYNVFGNRWGLASFIPMVVLFIVAYYFDHLGVLSLSITNLAAWAGISVTPVRILKDNDFNEASIIYAGLILGAALVALSFLVHYKNIKAHFAFTYKNFGAHILFISLLAFMFRFDNIYLLSFILLAAVSFIFFKNASKEKSFYFLVITFLYAYIGLSYVMTRLIFSIDLDLGSVYLFIIYFIASGIGLIRFFIHYNKIFKKNAGL